MTEALPQAAERDSHAGQSRADSQAPATSKRLPWVKLWASWYTSPSHRWLSVEARFIVGPALLTLANGPQRGWLLKPSGVPLERNEIAQEFKLSNELVQRAVDELIAVGTMALREDGALGFPRFMRYQEHNSTPRKAKQRQRERDSHAGMSRDCHDKKDRGTEGKKIRGPEGKDPPNPRKRGPAVDLVPFIEAWNRGAGKSGVTLAKAPSKQTQARDRRLAKEVERFPEPGQWEACARALAASPHHRGENDKKWPATLGWLLERGNGAKLEEWMAKGAALIDAPAKESNYRWTA